MENSLAKVEQEMANERLEEAGFDPVYGEAACDCEPGEPCCLHALEVADNKDKSRKIVWPVPEGEPNKLFMITKDPYAGSPSAEVEVKMTEFEECKSGNANMPGTLATGFADAPQHYYPTAAVVNTVTSPFHIPAALTALFPEDVLLRSMLLGII